MATFSLRLCTLGETPGSMARGGKVRKAARGVSPVAIGVTFTYSESCVNRDFHFAVFVVCVQV